MTSALSDLHNVVLTYFVMGRDLGVVVDFTYSYKKKMIMIEK